MTWDISDSMNSDSSSRNISRKVVKGGAWMLALRIIDRLFNFVRIIVLARLLAPEDFGIFAIALIAIMTLTTFSKTGFHGALIQRKGDISDYIDTAWAVQVVRGVFLATILFIAAPHIASFFEEPGATPILRVLALSLLFQGATNPGIAYFQRDLNFQRVFVYEMGGTIFDIAVSVTAAFVFRNVWALVYGLLARHLVQLILSFLMAPQMIKPRFELDKFKELFVFGKYVFLSSILNFLLIQGTQAFVGKILGAATLGFYLLAFRISDLPIRETINVVSRTTFPAYSRLQDQVFKLREGYSKILQMVSFILIPVAVGLFILSREFTQLFLGEKWMAIVPALRVLVIWGGLRAIHVTSFPLFKGIGKPGIETMIRFAQFLLLAAVIYPFSRHWNLLGTTMAVLLSELFVCPFYIYQIVKITGLSLRELARMALFPIVAALFMVGSILFLKSLALGYTDLLSFFIFIVTGALTYFGFVCLFSHFFNYRIFRTVDKYLIRGIKT